MKLTAVTGMLFLAAAQSAPPAAAQTRTPKGAEPPLPPELPWHGASATLLAPADHPWVTPAETSGLTRTPRYDETVSWLRRLAEAAPEIEMVSLGKSHEGRDLWMVIASADGAFTPEALQRTGKPILLAQAGIHAGEIDGKDAGMMLLRDMTVRGTQRQLLEGASLLLVPILNVDGHERFSPYGRINQRGPAATGWRRTARNLNLNRDYAKLDTPEMRALVAALQRWKPDLYVDIHVTDGADYQYDITWGYNGPQGDSPAIARWLASVLDPAARAELRDMGHTPGPLIFLADLRDPGKGNSLWTASPRFSTGYGDARHLPTVLVENHSLKPYRQRVLGTYVLLHSMLRTLARDGRALRRAVARDQTRRPQVVVLTRKAAAGKPATMDFLGIEAQLLPSAISGGLRVVWTGKPTRLRIPIVANTEPDLRVRRPRAYWIPPAWPEVIERLAVHGVEMERSRKAQAVNVSMYRLGDAKLEAQPVEGHVRVRASPTVEQRRHTFAPGAVRVPTDQPLGTLVVHLLEPDAPDSFFQWGFFLEVLESAEYAEGYVLEPLAERMLVEDAALARRFQRKLLEEDGFAADADKRLRWFYEQTPWFDERWLLYPVAREER